MAPDVKQGDIYWVDIPSAHTVGSEQYKRRPYIVVSRTSVNRNSRTVVGVPLTTADLSKPQHAYRIVIPSKEIVRDIGYSGDVKDSIAKTDQVRVLDKARLETKLGTLSNTATVAVGLGLAFLFDLR